MAKQRLSYSGVRVTAMVCLLAMVGGGCWLQAASAGRWAQSSSSDRTKGCVMKHNGVKSLIQPENSGLRCSAIRVIILVLSDQPGVQVVEDESGEPSWVCRVYQKSALPRELRCHQDQRHFERVRIQS